MKKSLLSFGVAAAAAISMTSCLGNSTSDSVSTFNYGNKDCFNRVVDAQTGETSITLNPVYTFRYNFSKESLDAELSNIKLGDGFSSLAFKLIGLSLKQDTKDGFLVSSGRDIIPYGAEQSFVFDTFNLRSLPGRRLGNYSIPVYMLTYTINNRYRVTVYPTTSFFVGSTESMTTNPDATTVSYTDKGGESYYSVQLDPEKMKAKLLVAGVKFNSTMASQNFTVTNLPLELTANGYKVVSEPGKTYEMVDPNNKVIANCSIKDININTQSMDYGTTISFRVDLQNLSEKDNAEYIAVANLRYLIYTTTDTNKPN
ncbi:MAG: hypothetical protein NC212_04395 [Staphylococcus sp.]|nr:hypothetical protein [Staphylococcus sp.]